MRNPKSAIARPRRAPTDYRLPATDYRLFPLQVPRTFAIIPTISTSDEPATSWLVAHPGRTDVVRPK